MHQSEAAVARSRRIFARRAAARDRHVVELLHLFRRIALEADGAAVRGSCRFPVDRLCDAEGPAIVPIEEPRMARRSLIVDGLPLETEHAENLVVERLGPLEIA